MRRSLGALLAVATLALTGMPPISSVAADHDRRTAPRSSDELRLFGPAAQPQGDSWALWSARYIEWLQEIPVGRNPAVHPDSPRNCELRHGVVMMAPYGTGRGCEIPTDTPILLTFNAWSCSTAEGNGRAWHQLRRCTHESFHQELSDIQVRFFLDDELVPHPARWRFDSARRVADLPENNIWGAPAGPTRTLATGEFFMVRPLSQGAHVMRARLKEASEVTVLRYRFTVD